jgi:tetratricopeptide (TPR) repeat protein
MRRLLLLVALFLLVGGCSDRSLIGRRVDNFTAYYNTYHNAEEAFTEGVQSLETDQQPVDRTAYLTLFLQPATGGGGQNFERTIDKSASLLRNHPNSKWVDDALLLIGKSYFYQQNYVGAEQKFEEVMALETRLEGEARFWLARTLGATGRYEAAAEHLRLSLEAGDFGRWTARMRLVQGELQVQQGNWAEAARALEQGLEGRTAPDLAARAYFLLGQVYETQSRYAQAAEAYRAAAQKQPRYELRFAARLSAAQMTARAGQPQRALETIRRMAADDKNFEKQAELAVARAELLRAAGQNEAARDALRDVLYDASASVSSDVRGRAHYQLAQVYRDAFDNFKLAAAHFDTAATAIGSPRQTDEASRPAPAAITDAQAQADSFGGLAERAASVQRLDSLLYLGGLSEGELQEVVAQIRARRAEEQAAQASAQRRAAAARNFEAVSGGAARSSRSDQAPTQASSAATSSSDAGFLFHQNPTRVQEGRRAFERRWGNRPRVPNWRRLEAVASASSGSTRTRERAPERAEVPGATGPAVDLSAVPRDSSSRAEMRVRRNEARYELANALFLAASRPDSAAYWYRQVLDEGDAPAMQRRALYALAEAERAAGDSTAAQGLYRRVIETYPESAFAQRARERLGMDATSEPEPVTRRPTQARRAVQADTTAVATPEPPPDAGGPAEADSSAIVLEAEREYAAARALWEKGERPAAKQRMAALAAQHPRTPVAPRALLAAGLLHLEQARGDSLRLRGPLPPALQRAMAGTDSTAAPNAADTTGTGGTVRRDTTATGATPPDTNQTPPQAGPGAQDDPSPQAAEERQGAGEKTQAARQGALRRVGPADTTAAPRDTVGSTSRDTAPATDTSATTRADSVHADRSRRVDRSPPDREPREEAAAPQDNRPTRPNTGVRSDTTRAAATDTTAYTTTVDTAGTGIVSVDTASVDTVSTAAARTDTAQAGPVPLQAYFQHIAARYAGTPSARRAQAIAEALAERFASRTAGSARVQGGAARPDGSAQAPRSQNAAVPDRAGRPESKGGASRSPDGDPARPDSSRTSPSSQPPAPDTSDTTSAGAALGPAAAEDPVVAEGPPPTPWRSAGEKSWRRPHRVLARGCRAGLVPPSPT